MTDSNHRSGSFLDKYFAEKVCINLARRPERWFRAQKEFRTHGLTSVHRFEAFDGTAMRLPDGWDYGAGSYGCLRSHTAVVEAARDKGSASILILEDDVVFHPDLDTLFGQYAGQIPSDWDALLFGGFHLEPPEPLSRNIVRLKRTSSTYAIAMRHTLYDAFLEINRDTMIAVDENNHALEQSFKFYGFMPHLAWVTRDHSDVMEGEVNPWWLQHSIGLFGPDQERIIRGVGVILFFDSGSFQNWTEAQPSIELMQSVLRLYSAVVEETAICVVERGPHPLLAPGDIPGRCFYRFCTQDQSPVQCANTAAALLGDRQYFICGLSDIYPLRSELRASLLCSPQYDILVPMCAPLPLDAEDTRKMLRDEVSAVDTGRYPVVPADPLAADFCIISAPLLRQTPESPKRSELLTPALLERSRVFQSPSRLVRLSRSSKAVGTAGV